MLAPKETLRPEDAGYFGAKTKCCTYVPRVANFLVGGLFVDPDPALEDGRQRALARMQQRRGLSPLGLLPTGLESLTLANASAAFGKHRAVICPNFRESDGGCTSWRYRSSVCMTWFCKHERGSVGSALWHAVERLVGVIERAVAVHCILELELGDAAYAALGSSSPPTRELSVHDLDGGDEAGARRTWGRWFGREREFFEACAGIAFELDAEAVKRLGGAELSLSMRAVHLAQRAYSDRSIPERLSVGGFKVLSIGPETTRLTTYSPYDPVEVPNGLVPLLSLFDGRATRAIVADAEEKYGVRLEDDLLRQLADFALVGPPSE